MYWNSGSCHDAHDEVDDRLEASAVIEQEKALDQSHQDIGDGGFEEDDDKITFGNPPDARGDGAQEAVVLLRLHLEFCLLRNSIVLCGVVAVNLWTTLFFARYCVTFSQVKYLKWSGQIYNLLMSSSFRMLCAGLQWTRHNKNSSHVTSSLFRQKVNSSQWTRHKDCHRVKWTRHTLNSSCGDLVTLEARWPSHTELI